ncbi:hypothetical protein SK1NUM_26140 [Arachnia rubra]|nr:hypothetical protein SK1NUM_26140 [Arachnia rubra]
MVDPTKQPYDQGAGGDFSEFLDKIASALQPTAPHTAAMMKSVHAGYLARTQQGAPGITPETLISDLVRLLASLEMRLAEVGKTLPDHEK